MKMIMEAVNGYPCTLAIFTINEIQAAAADFVDQYDADPSAAEDYGCGEMQADIIKATDRVLIKYKITLEEYNEIAAQVAEKLSIGSCNWCE